MGKDLLSHLRMASRRRAASLAAIAAVASLLCACTRSPPLTEELANQGASGAASGSSSGFGAPSGSVPSTTGTAAGAAAGASSGAAPSGSHSPPSADASVDAALDAALDAAREGGSDATSETGGGTVTMSGPLSNVCTKTKVSITSDIFNPGDVYFDGETVFLACGADIIAHWSDPSVGCYGFDCNHTELDPVIRPTDGRILYISDMDNLREFHGDACPSRSASAVPTQPLANDPVVPTPPCVADSNGNPVDTFRISPEGVVYYRCGSTSLWYANGNKVYDDSAADFLSVGRNKVALVAGQQDLMLVDLTTGTPTTVTPRPTFPTYPFLGVRATDSGGFWLAVNPPGAAVVQADLWQVDAKAALTMVGSYPPMPTTDIAGIGKYSALDGCGALLQMGGYKSSSNTFFVRREIMGASQVVYDTTNSPFVLPAFGFVTGP